MGLFDELAANAKLGLVKGHTDFWNVELVPCGIPALDYILGGGAAYGRVMEMFGNESSGKSLVLYKFLIENTKRSGASVLFDAEGSFNPDFYKMLGGDPSTLLILQPSTVEEVFDTVLAYCTAKSKSKSKDQMVVGWDSVAETGTDHLEETGMETVDMSHPRMMSQGFKLTKKALREANIAFICINQTRQKIAAPGQRVFGPPEDVTPGGKALTFAASQRLKLSYNNADKWKIYEDPDDREQEDETTPRIGRKKKEESEEKKKLQQIGRKVIATAMKSKVSGAWLECVLYTYGFAGAPHPQFEGLKTSVGIDSDETLLDFFLDGYCFLPNGGKVVQRPSQGYLSLDPSLDPSGEKFKRKEWPMILEARPDLRTLLYELLKKQPVELDQEAPDAPPEATT